MAGKGDDSGGLILNYPVIIDVLLAQRRPESSACHILANYAKEEDPCIERAEVGGSIGRTPWNTMLRRLAYNWNGSFSTEPGGGSLKVGIKHGIADHQRAKLTKAPDKINRRTHGLHLLFI